MSDREALAELQRLYGTEPSDDAQKGGEMADCHCILCGKLPPDGTHSVAITVPVKDYRNQPLATPGFYFACKNCRQGLAVAEKEQKRLRREVKGEGAVN
jgi:hypothetical protein